MSLEYRTDRGGRVVVLGNERLTTLRGWLAEIDVGALRVREGAADALLMDFRAPGVTPAAREANALVAALVALCANRCPPLAILTNPGPQYGGARMLCALGELRGCLAQAFDDEAQAWEWLHGQVGARLRRAEMSA